MTLLYPQWETASHAPTAEVKALAGLQIRVDGHLLPWRRDPFDVFAFHVEPPFEQQFQNVNILQDGPLAEVSRVFINATAKEST
jgi:hypothetical protein